MSSPNHEQSSADGPAPADRDVPPVPGSLSEQLLKSGRGRLSEDGTGRVDLILRSDDDLVEYARLAGQTAVASAILAERAP